MEMHTHPLLPVTRHSAKSPVILSECDPPDDGGAHAPIRVATARITPERGICQAGATHV
jgi:hypothetical protein